MDKVCSNCKHFHKFKWSYGKDKWETCHCFYSPYDDGSLKDCMVSPDHSCEHFEKGERND